jgi:glucose/arabinose dehydrogenase
MKQKEKIMKRFLIILTALASLSFLIIGFFSNNASSSEKIYSQYCATCHGANFQGGMAKSLADGKWHFGSSNEEIANSISKGIIESGMPSFGNVLSDDQINDLVYFIKEKTKPFKTPEYKVEDIVETFDYELKVEMITDEVEEPWGISFISEDEIIVTEKAGGVRIIKNGKLSSPLSGTPEVRYSGQGGMLGVAVDPNYKENGWIYLSFSHDIDGKGMTKLVRGKIEGNTWTNEQTIFQAKEEHYIDSRHHFGCRIVFDDNGHLFFSIGDRGQREHAQDLSRPNGKIHRINLDGTIPADNPFINDENTVKSIFSFGNRNAQGLAVNPETGELWESEHGQKGGDEINIIKSGKNYGWDKITYGRNYDGSVSSEHVKLPGMEVPVLFWRPSIAVCGIDFYTGNLFPKWENHLVVGALKYEEVRLLDIEDDRVIHQEIIFKDGGRVRDVSVSPNGAIYLALNSPDKIVRLVPNN